MRLITRRALFCGIVLFAGTIGRAQETTTNGMPNGHFWKLMDANTKVAMMAGIQIGFVLSFLGNDLTERAQKVLQRYSFKGPQFEEVIGKIDAFYSVSDRLDQPIPVAYLFASGEMQDLATVKDEAKDAKRQIEKLLQETDRSK